MVKLIRSQPALSHRRSCSSRVWSPERNDWPPPPSPRPPARHTAPPIRSGGRSARVHVHVNTPPWMWRERSWFWFAGAISAAPGQTSAPPAAASTPGSPQEEEEEVGAGAPWSAGAPSGHGRWSTSPPQTWDQTPRPQVNGEFLKKITIFFLVLHCKKTDSPVLHCKKRSTPGVNSPILQEPFSSRFSIPPGRQ